MPAAFGSSKSTCHFTAGFPKPPHDGGDPACPTTSSSRSNRIRPSPTQIDFGPRRARAAFSHDLRIACILRSPFLILETPPGLRFEAAQVLGLRELAGMAVDGLRLGLEARAYRGQKKLPEALRRTMEQDRVLDVVDLSQGPPRVPDEVVYTRLFGPGPANVYQFDDTELRAIDRASGDAVRAALTFHGVRMYTDAARFLAFT